MFIDKLKELDKERTQGDWEVVETKDCLGVSYYHIRPKDSEAPFTWTVVEDNECLESDQRFIAEAPRMARILILIHEICKVVEQESEDDPTDLAKLMLRILEKE